VVLLIVAVTLLCGLYSMRWWMRRTQRRFNIGFAAGGIALLIMMVWVGTALAICIAGSKSAKSTGDSLETITALAIIAQQARADETLSLIRRGDENIRRQSYYQRIDLMQRELNEYLAHPDAIATSDMQNAAQLLGQWRQAVDRTNSNVPVGNYWALTEGSGAQDSTRAFDNLEEAFDNGIQESRGQLRDVVIHARAGLSGATVGAVALSVVTAMAVITGLWPRMNE
jgi:hypothetical protein